MAIKWERNAFTDILKSGAVRADVRRRAERVAAAAGPGFDAVSSIGLTRARAAVITSDHEALIRNSRENTLIRALEAGRGN